MTTDFIAGYIAGLLFNGRRLPVDLESCTDWLIGWAAERRINFEESWLGDEGDGFRRLVAYHAFRLDDYAEAARRNHINADDLVSLENYLRALEGKEEPR